MPSSPPTTRTGREFAVLFATLLLFWLLLNGSLAFDVLVTGIAVAALIGLLSTRGLSFFTEMRWSAPALTASLRYLALFFRELVRANLAMAAIVLSPSLPVRPAIVRVGTRLTSRMGRLLLANSISLTPGTLTVWVEKDILYVHCVAIDPQAIDTATRDIAAGFESCLEVMYG
jgi:multicomponent Na+:H+ antiporter subunit E